jgi:hypothetical protein
MVVFCVCGYCLVVSRGNLMVGVWECVLCGSK